MTSVAIAAETRADQSVMASSDFEGDLKALQQNLGAALSVSDEQSGQIRDGVLGFPRRSQSSAEEFGGWALGKADKYVMASSDFQGDLKALQKNSGAGHLSGQIRDGVLGFPRRSQSCAEEFGGWALGRVYLSVFLKQRVMSLSAG
ncbi:hypothetical protein OPV22_001738 [Ensete ventricosum]|uniref:Uncharacterized protein n=1 Tax=Ensete ventricosum TaxID=4639 RepID=A0AAV8RVU4_ENSVE|nr:hypothetical protein OPV22_001738 [Ensete ventricosum]